jgi:hypothetical protein
MTGKKYLNRRSVLATGVSLPLGACGWLDTDSVRWTEEIMLHDGR